MFITKNLKYILVWFIPIQSNASKYLSTYVIYIFTSIQKLYKCHIRGIEHSPTFDFGIAILKYDFMISKIRKLDGRGHGRWSVHILAKQ